jgi:4-hydroxybenzoate polyprenyltransferase
MPNPLPAAPQTHSALQLPLCVDLDGTLVRTNTLLECALARIRHSPAVLLLLPFWLLRGRACLWSHLGPESPLKVESLPYNPAVLEFLREEAATGRSLVLVTGAHEAIARRVASHCGLFTRVEATSGGRHLVGKRKADCLAAEYGEGGFDYVGDSSLDLAVWRRSRRAIVVNPTPALLRKLGEAGRECRTLGMARSSWAWLRVLRPHQWVKNVLVFGPAVLSHSVAAPGVLPASVLAFLACCLAGSGTYVANDLLDLEADREHGSKRSRPFASGAVPLELGFVLAPLLLAAGLLLAFSVGAGVAGMVGLYILLSSAYSLWLKRVAALDVTLLAGFYCLRLLVGSVATGIPLSTWAGAFSMFFFFSVALMKRYAEIDRLRAAQKTVTPGRGYRAGDAQAIMSLGSASGMMAVLVMALYLNGGEAGHLYRHRNILWLECIIVLLATTRLWIRTGRGEMDEDPVLFALRDGAIALLAALAVVVMVIAM